MGILPISVIASLALGRPQDKNGLDRPYQEHLGGLDKAYKRTL